MEGKQNGGGFSLRRKMGKYSSIQTMESVFHHWRASTDRYCEINRKSCISGKECAG